jgi:NAD(P)H-nitrite reductase large subunit
MNMNDEILICRCKEVSDQEIREAIADGARSVTGVKRRTEAGMGLCQGRTCRRLIANMIASSCEISVAQLEPETARPPVRPVKIDSLLKPTDRSEVMQSDGVQEEGDR